MAQEGGGSIGRCCVLITTRIGIALHGMEGGAINPRPLPLPAPASRAPHTPPPVPLYLATTSLRKLNAWNPLLHRVPNALTLQPLYRFFQPTLPNPCLRFPHNRPPLPPPHTHTCTHAALGLYDLPLAYMVVVASPHKDPGEALAELQRFGAVRPQPLQVRGRGGWGGRWGGVGWWGVWGGGGGGGVRGGVLRSAGGRGAGAGPWWARVRVCACARVRASTVTTGVQ